MAKPGMIVTGATGFIGRHVLDAFGRDHRIWALSRRAPSLHGISLPASVRWLSTDVARSEDVTEAFEAIRRAGGAETLVHLAAHYDFTGERDPEYERTNVVGTSNVLEGARRLGVRDFVFASSVAACDFPARGSVITETTPPDGDTPYAESKRAGEALVARHRDELRCWIVRFAALYSDWCEFEPLFRFLETWLSPGARGRLVAGCGLSAIPYLHVCDAMTCLRRLLARREQLDADLPVLASSDGATSHLELFEAATGACYGKRARPVLVPGPLCRIGLRIRDLIGRIVGLPAFEKPWMGRMIDRQLTVDAHRSRERLGWAPRDRLSIVRRMPFLIQNRKSFHAEWQRRNHAALKSARGHENREIVSRLQEHMEAMSRTLAEHVLDAARAHRFPKLRAIGADRQRADDLLLLDALARAVRTGEKEYFRSACRDLAIRRADEGIALEELTALLHLLGDQCVLTLADHDPSESWNLALYDHVTMTVQFGVDEILDLMETAGPATWARGRAD